MDGIDGRGLGVAAPGVTPGSRFTLFHSWIDKN